MSRTIEEIAHDARLASKAIADLPGKVRAQVLIDLADLIRSSRGEILAANAHDMNAARQAGLEAPKLTRLEITSAGIDQMASGLMQIAALPDPVGEVTRRWKVPSGLSVSRVRTPLGVIAMIYEARPGVTIDAFALCFKSGNACILKGGREALRSSQTLADLARRALGLHSAPEDSIAVIASSDRNQLRRLLALSADIDLVIPRGGEPLIRFVHEHSRIPTIQHFRGVCHVYIDKHADPDAAIEIVATGKASAPATCNATECALVHRDIAPLLVPRLASRCAELGITLRADDRSLQLASGAPNVEPAQDADWGREYLDLTLALRTVNSMDEALDHIARYTSDHTETIVTDDPARAEAFTRRVRSSCVLVNASTRFNDGFQLGLGAELGISTTRLHAYGPMGLEGLTIERFVVHGSGQTR